MFEQCFKNIDDKLRKDSGVSTELDYVEQTSWLLFLKYLDDLEQTKSMNAVLDGKTYTPIIDKEFSWSEWAYPTTEDGKLDHHRAKTGDDLKEFVDLKLFPYLKKFKKTAESPDTLEYKIGEIFGEIKNRIQSGYCIRDIINVIQEMRFQTSEEKHELSCLYEDKIQNMGNTGRNGGEYYTPRPLIKTIIKTVKPKLGNKIYDGAVGSAGFLVEAFDYLKNSKKDLTVDEMETLQKQTLFGKEKKPLPYVISIMNMILHGIEAPNIIHTNTLSENIMSIQDKDRFDVVIANPPFGGSERAEIQQNFPIKTSETAYLFLQHFIKSLKAGGGAGIIIKNTFLSNGDAAAVRKELLESCNLYAVLDLPGKVFTAGVKTVVLFFKKGEPTKKIWYYQLNLDRNLGKTNPLNEDDLVDFLECVETFKETENSWTVDIDMIDNDNLDLSVKNPNKNDEVVYRTPEEIIAEMQSLDEESAEILARIKELV
ncbi:MAG: N-6 DNA methylase [Candidatus Gastranaerophilales bacterium]|nr:N-6 DNA methylase [Candidatus Gastranaerophilales bacterium]